MRRYIEASYRQDGYTSSLVEYGLFRKAVIGFSIIRLEMGKLTLSDEKELFGLSADGSEKLAERSTSSWKKSNPCGVV